MPDGPSKEQAKEIDNDVNKANNEHAADLKGAMGGGCSPELSKQVTGTLTAVVSVVDKVNKVLSAPGGGMFRDDSLQKIYENTKKTNDNALLNEYIAEKNYMINNMEQVWIIYQRVLTNMVNYYLTDIKHRGKKI